MTFQCMTCGHAWSVKIIRAPYRGSELNEDGTLKYPAEGTWLNRPERCPKCTSKFYMIRE